MAGAKLSVNGKDHTVPAVEGVSLQFALRDDLDLTGTKFGCGVHQCGACTVLVDGAPVRSCTTKLKDVIGKKITTIEGLADLAKNGNGHHPLQDAWTELQVPQCGYCQSGQLMEAAGLLSKNPNPSEDQIRQAMDGHICRCGTYNQILQAIQLAASRM
jgi:isoquinoline 1-oxidoreductase subunit alpha